MQSAVVTVTLHTSLSVALLVTCYQYVIFGVEFQIEQRMREERHLFTQATVRNHQLKGIKSEKR